jgi:hypothetical protein
MGLLAAWHAAKTAARQPIVSRRKRIRFVFA